MKRPAPFACRLARRFAGLLAALAAVFSGPALSHAAAPGNPPADISAPTLVTLHYDHTDPKIILDDLFHQLGVDNYSYSPAFNTGDYAIPFNADKQPFWTVMDQLGGLADLGMNMNGNRVSISPINRGASAGIHLVSGRCMIIARTIAHRALLTDPAHLDECNIECTLMPEPNLRIASYNGRIRPDIAVDEKGVSLVPPPEPPPTGALANGFRTQYIEPETKTLEPNTQATFQIVPHVPSNAGHQLADVKGVNHLKVVTKTTKIEFTADEFSTEHTLNFHGATITVSPIRNTRQPPDAEYSVSVSVNREGLDDDDWNDISSKVDAAEISILDDKGTPYNQGGPRCQPRTYQPLHVGPIRRRFRIPRSRPGRRPRRKLPRHHP